jgi:hypothetical protein
MTNRVAYAPQDFKKMCEQAERDHESRKLVVLLDRVKKQIAARQNASPNVDSPKPPTAISSDIGVIPMPSRSAPFDR